MAIVKATKATAEKALKAVDWAAQDALTDADIERQAAENPDAAPILTDRESAAGMVLALRARLKLSQAAFADRYGIPVGTLRDWEQRRRIPDQAATSYLKVIMREPEMTARALGTAAE
ncbi:helix-turn-helix domain-containing protein [Rhodovarius crocodyli]|uniref:Helix-turn-helix domain-containing protein n=1 Tax=Rhodovarius crocodyli TaxID=1979269 RepID=A0A437MN76_9PROT|nr:helix-turn-helix domain-containing protein [Rhodovarius crocodyli]RVT99108.1 helix-turn-helix domain-containing protein [Rhodovarius crocodyli]